MCLVIFYFEIFVFKGNLALPVLKALSMILGSFMPHISNNIEPPFTFTPQWDTGPFPFPILEEIGLAVIGKSGKTLIQIFPFFFIFLEIACLEASICRPVIIAELTAFNPTVPNLSLFVLNSSFRSLPFLVFLYLVFLGCKNILLYFF